MVYKFSQQLLVRIATCCRITIPTGDSRGRPTLLDLFGDFLGPQSEITDSFGFTLGTDVELRALVAAMVTTEHHARPVKGKRHIAAGTLGHISAIAADNEGGRTPPVEK